MTDIKVVDETEVVTIKVESCDQSEAVTLHVADVPYTGTTALSVEDEQRITDLENSTDGLIGGVDFLTHYILRRDN